MRTLLILCVLLLIALEFFLVYFIMPLPGSQRMNSLPLAYFLWHWRWVLRLLFAFAAVFIAWRHPRARHWSALILLALFAAVAYAFNGPMSASGMFAPVKNKQMATATENKVDSNLLVIGVSIGNEAAAYPIQYIAYHHRVQDTVGGKAVFVTYCSVCRTGRVYEPIVQGKPAEFRLVGMDHFNAMFEDQSTKSWWRQATGEAVAGKRKGRILPEFPSTQTTLQKWSELFPQTLVMQPDEGFQEVYDSLSNYETGKRKGTLTRRDTGSWKDKSWVIGIQIGDEAKAYDWNRLQKERIVHDLIGKTPVLLALSSDKNSFVAFSRSNPDQLFSLLQDTLYTNSHRFNFLGKSLQDSVPDLQKVPAYQEYWHSWKTFHPQTKKW